MKDYSFIKIGANVYWTDPDDGKSSGIYQVYAILLPEEESIEYDTIICIRNEAGSDAEVEASELSIVWGSKSSVYGITFTNNVESVAQTGYVFQTLEEAQAAAIRGLVLNTQLSTDTLGVQVDGLNSPDNSQAIRYAVIETEGDSVQTITLEDLVKHLPINKPGA